MPRQKPTTDLPDPLAGCSCRVHRGTITVDLAALVAVPEEVAAAFLEASFEAAHAWVAGWPFADEDAYVRGGIAAVDPLIRVDERSRWARLLRTAADQKRRGLDPATLRKVADRMETEAPDA